MQMAKFELRRDPLTVYLLLLASYGVLMCVRTLHKRHYLTTLTTGTLTQADEQQQEEVVLNRKKRGIYNKATSDDLTWLENTNDLLQQLRIPEQTCKKLIKRSSHDSCNKSHGTLGCLDEDVAPRHNRCTIFSLSARQRKSISETTEFFFGCKLTSIDISDVARKYFVSKMANQRIEPNSTGKGKYAHLLQLDEKERGWVTLPRLMASGQLQHMNQLLIEIQLPLNNLDDHMVVPKLRGYWGILQMLSVLGFRRVQYMANPYDRFVYPVQPKFRPNPAFEVNNTSKQHSSSVTAPLNSDPNIVDSFHGFYNSGTDKSLKKFPLKYFSSADDSNTGDALANKEVDGSKESKLVRGVLLYVYRPNTHAEAHTHHKNDQANSNKDYS